MATLMAYNVSCSECGYEDRMGTVAEIFERQEEHQDRYSTEHVLEFDVRE